MRDIENPDIARAKREIEEQARRDDQAFGDEVERYSYLPAPKDVQET